MTMRAGANGSSSRATAIPTRPEPPSIRTCLPPISIPTRSCVGYAALHRGDLFGRQVPPPARRQLAQSNGTVAHATQPYHVMTCSLEHAPHFALATFAQRQRQPRRREAPRALGPSRAVIQLDAARQLLQHIVRDR